jgi:hypothetical protein
MFSLSARHAGLLSLVLAGCTQPPDRFYIVQNQAPQQGQGCVIPSDQSAEYRGEGILDVSLVDGALGAYFVFPLLKNDLTKSSGDIQLYRIRMSGFDIAVQAHDALPAAVAKLFADPASQPLLHHREPWSGTVNPGGGVVAATTDAISGDLARKIRDANDWKTTPYLELDAQISARGDNEALGSVESDAFLYPIKVCSGCLVADVIACPYAMAPMHPGNACNPAQDDPVDCCSNPGGSLVCPPIVVMSGGSTDAGVGNVAVPDAGTAPGTGAISEAGE